MKREESKETEEDGDDEDPKIGEKLDIEMEDNEPDENWVFPREPATKEERKRLLSCTGKGREVQSD